MTNQNILVQLEQKVKVEPLVAVSNLQQTRILKRSVLALLDSLKSPEIRDKKIERFYEIIAPIVSRIIKTKDMSALCGLIDISAEIQRKVIKRQDKDSLGRLRKSIFIKKKIHPFVKFLYWVPGEKFRYRKFVHLFFDATNMLYSKTFSEKANESVSSQYSGREHWLFEMLQNARDAKSTRVFIAPLGESSLMFSNNGISFSTLDAWSICSVGQSTKGKGDIGFFGQGTKALRHICRRFIVKSDPFAFRINVDLKHFDYFVEHSLSKEKTWERACKIPESSAYENSFLLEEIEKKKFRNFFKYLQQIDDTFLLFLSPLEEIKVSGKKPLKRNLSYESKDTVSLVRIRENFYFKTTLSQDLGLTDAEGNSIGSREVQIVVPVIQRSEIAYEVVKDTSYSLYEYFPVIHRKPEFNFILHGQFSLLNSREDLVNFESGSNEDVQINKTILREIAPKCYLQLYRELTESPYSIIGLELTLPLKENVEKEVYSFFRQGLITQLKSEKNQSVRIWKASGSSQYIPFKNIVFAPDDTSIELLSFFQSNFPDHFREIFNEILDLGGNKDEFYFCNDIDAINFCKEVFPETEQEITHDQILSFIIEFLTRRSPPIKTIKNAIKTSNWEGYFDSMSNYTFFIKTLVNWSFYKQNEKVRTQLDPFYLLLLENCFGEAYFLKASFSDYWYYSPEIMNALPEALDIIRKSNDVFLKRELNIEPPLRVPLNASKEELKFYSAKKYFSVYTLFSLVIEDESGVKYNALSGSSDIINSLINLVAKVFLELTERKTSLKKTKEYYYALNQTEDRNEQFFKELAEDSEQESFILAELLVSLLKHKIFPNYEEKRYPFFSLTWGTKAVCDLLRKTEFKLNLIHRKLTNLSNSISELVEKSRASLQNGSQFPLFTRNYVSIEELKERINAIPPPEISGLTCKEVAEKVNHFESRERKNRLEVIFLSSEEVFSELISLMYGKGTDKIEKIVLLSSHYTPKRYLVLEGQIPVYNCEEKYSYEIMDLLNELSKLLKIKPRAIVYHKDIPNSIRNRLTFSIASITSLDIIKELVITLSTQKIETIEIWQKFYDLFYKMHVNGSISKRITLKRFFENAQESLKMCGSTPSYSKWFLPLNRVFMGSEIAYLDNLKQCLTLDFLKEFGVSKFALEKSHHKMYNRLIESKLLNSRFNISSADFLNLPISKLLQIKLGEMKYSKL